MDLVHTIYCFVPRYRPALQPIPSCVGIIHVFYILLNALILKVVQRQLVFQVRVLLLVQVELVLHRYLNVLH
jgi:hypothetical protein